MSKEGQGGDNSKRGSVFEPLKNRFSSMFRRKSSNELDTAQTSSENLSGSRSSSSSRSQSSDDLLHHEFPSKVSFEERFQYTLELLNSKVPPNSPIEWLEGEQSKEGNKSIVCNIRINTTKVSGTSISGHIAKQIEENTEGRVKPHVYKVNEMSESGFRIPMEVLAINNFAEILNPKDALEINTFLTKEVNAKNSVYTVKEDWNMELSRDEEIQYRKLKENNEQVKFFMDEGVINDDEIKNLAKVKDPQDLQKALDEIENKKIYQPETKSGNTAVMGRGRSNRVLSMNPLKITDDSVVEKASKEEPEKWKSEQPTKSQGVSARPKSQEPDKNKDNGRT